MYYVYVLQDLNDEEKFYIGCTKDLRERLRSHNAGENRSTKGREWRVVYYEAYMSLSGARTREYRLKQNGKSKYQLLKRIKESLE